MENQTTYVKTAKGIHALSDLETISLPWDLVAVLEAIDGKSSFQILLQKLTQYSPLSLQAAIERLVLENYVEALTDTLPVVKSSIGIRLDERSDMDIQRKITENQVRRITESWQREIDEKSKQEEEKKFNQIESASIKKSAEALQHQRDQKIEGTEKYTASPKVASVNEFPQAAAEKGFLTNGDDHCETAKINFAQRAIQSENSRMTLDIVDGIPPDINTREILKETQSEEPESASNINLIKKTSGLSRAETIKLRKALPVVDFYNAEIQLPISPADSVSTTPISTPDHEKQAWGQIIFQVFVFLLVVGFSGVHIYPFSSQIAALEKTGTRQFGQSVTIERLSFAFLPTPRWRAQNVVIGRQGEIHLAQVIAKTGVLGFLNGHPTIENIEAEMVTLSPAGVSWLLLGKMHKNELGIVKINAKKVVLSSAEILLPLINAEATLDIDGQLQQAKFTSSEKKFHAEIDGAQKEPQVKLTAAAYSLPLKFFTVVPNEMDGMVLKNFSLIGSLLPKSFLITSFSGDVYGGVVEGKARLSWDSGWQLNGELSAKALGTELIFPALSDRGLLGGVGQFALAGENLKNLVRSARVEGEFRIERGVVRGIDLGRMLQGFGGGGTTFYDSYTGKFIYGNQRTSLRNTQMTAGLISAKGDASVDEDQQIRGRFLVELKSLSFTEQGSFSLAGNLRNPQFQR